MKLISLLFLASLFLGLNCLAVDASCPIPDEKEHYIFLGKSGVGKTTIVNALMKKVSSEKSSSVTNFFTSYKDPENDNIYYHDTLGLEETQLGETAKKIEIALKQSGTYKIFFVITLEGGRLRPADIGTIDMIIESIDLPKKSYSVIINKLTKKDKNTLKKRMSTQQEATNENIIKTELRKKNPDVYIGYIDNEIALDDQLDDQDEESLTFSKETLAFFKLAPAFSIQPNKIKKIEGDKLEKTISGLKTQLNKAESWSVSKVMVQAAGIGIGLAVVAAPVIIEAASSAVGPVLQGVEAITAMMTTNVIKKTCQH